MNSTLYHICEVPFFNGNANEAAKLIADSAIAGQSGYVCAVNTHSIVCSKENALLETALSSSLFNTADGIPLYWISILFKLTGVSHITGSDLMSQLLGCAQENKLPVYFYGCDDRTLNLIKIKLQSEYSKLIIAGMQAPGEITIPPELDLELITELAYTKAKIVFVGLGCPKQEIWMNLHAQKADCVFIGVGAVFDFYSENKKRSPEWMTKAGLEWFHRMCTDPKRLLKRYLVNNTRFIILVLRYLLLNKLVKQEQIAKYE